VPAGYNNNKTPIFISGFRDPRANLLWLRTSGPGGLRDQLKREKLVDVLLTADSFQAIVSALFSLDERKWVFQQLHAHGGLLCAASGKEPGEVYAWENFPGVAGIP
jgi:hypothetical protein